MAQRLRLKKLGFKDRHRFTATVARFGEKTGYDGKPVITIMLADVALYASPHDILTGHIWVSQGKWVKWAKKLRLGQRISFNAHVGRYLAGFKISTANQSSWDREDFRLVNVSHLTILDAER